MISCLRSSAIKSQLLWKSIFTMIFLVFCYQAYQSLGRGWTTDFKTFYLAGNYLVHRMDIYSIDWSSDYGPFLNGPMYALFMAPFTIMSPRIALAAFQICNSLIILGCAYFLSKKFQNNRYYVMGTILSLTVIFNAIRVNIRFGQVMIILLAAFAVFYFFYDRRTGKWDDFIAALAIGLIIHIKPYIALPILILILVQKRWRVMLWGLLLQAFFFLVLSYWLHENLLFRWVNKLASRQENSLTTHNDQGSLLSMLIGSSRLPEIVSYVSVFGIVLLVFVLLMICLLNRNVPTDRKVIFSAISGTLMTTYLHNYDYVLLFFPILFFVLSSNTHFLLKAATVGLSATVPVSGLPYMSVLLSQFVTIAVFWLNQWYYHRKTSQSILSFAVCYFISTVPIVTLSLVSDGDTLWLIKLQLLALNFLIFISLISKYDILHRNKKSAYQKMAA